MGNKSPPSVLPISRTERTERQDTCTYTNHPTTSTSNSTALKNPSTISVQIIRPAMNSERWGMGGLLHWLLTASRSPCRKELLSAGMFGGGSAMFGFCCCGRQQVAARGGQELLCLSICVVAGVTPLASSVTA